MLTIPLMIAIAALVLALLALTVVIITARKQSQLIERQQQRLMMLTETASDVLELKHQLAQQSQSDDSQPLEQVQKALTEHSNTLQQQVDQLQQEQQALQHKFQQLAEQDPGAKLYQRAAKLVADGATTEDIMQACDLPRAEAELIRTMKGK